MNTFRTTVSVTPSTRPVDLKKPVLTLGSCFADAIGDRLKKFKFFSMVNPFGVIYNPHSIHKALGYALKNERAPMHTYLENENIFFNYDFHSQLSSLNQHELESKLQSTIDEVNRFLKDASVIVITYGTSWVYQRNDTKEIVANCHKVPQKEFAKRLLTEEEIVASFEQVYAQLKANNPEVRFIVTVSPVRHLKDTLELNGLSKAILRSACHTLVNQFKDVEYFPAYEIMMDDLRDYRFYKADMIHPTEEAEDYIWALFAEKYFNQETLAFIEEWRSVLSALHHKPFHPSSPAHQIFLKNLLLKIEKLKGIVNTDQEIHMIRSQLNNVGHGG